MCTELVPILHTRENFVPDLHMCDEYLTNSSHVRSYLLQKNVLINKQACLLFHTLLLLFYLERQFGSQM